MTPNLETIGHRVPDAELAEVELLKLGFRKGEDGEFRATRWDAAFGTERSCTVRGEDLRARPLETLMFAREWAGRTR